MTVSRKLSELEQQQLEANLSRSLDSLFQWAQLKMVLRLLKDEDGIDKETLDYVNGAINNIFNKMLQEGVPKVEKRKKTFIEMTETDFDTALQKDPLLYAFRQKEYIYHIMSPEAEEKEHSINDLSFVALNSNRFMLNGMVGGKDWAIIDSNPITEVMVPDILVPEQLVSVPHGVYRIWCFTCKEFFTYEMNLGSPLENIRCEKCQSVLIEKRERRSQVPESPESLSSPET